MNFMEILAEEDRGSSSSRLWAKNLIEGRL